MRRLSRSSLLRAAAYAAWAACAATLRAPAVAQPRLDLSAGFDNNVRPGSWNPLHVRLSNVTASGPGTLQVVVQARSGTRTYVQPVQLTAGGSPLQRTLTYFHPTFGDAREIRVRVQSQGRTHVEKKLENVPQLTQGQTAIVAFTPDQSGLNFLGGLDLGYQRNDAQQSAARQAGSPPMSRTNPRVLYPRIETLPASANGYVPVDFVVMGDISLDQFTEDQWHALTSWVRDGGVLVVSGGGDLNRFRRPQIAEILPLKASGTRQVSAFPGLRYQYGVEPPRGQAAVITGSRHPEALVLCQQEGLPLVVERKVGNGLVVFTTFDLLSPQFRAWRGQEALWREIANRGYRGLRFIPTIQAASESANFNRYGGSSWGASGLTDALAGVQSAEPPNFLWIGLFLTLYILVLVPVNYLVLRKWDRKELAWVTIPAVILVFSIGAYIVGYRIKGGQLYLNFASVLEGSAGSRDFDSYTVASIFSPRQARYDLAIADPAALATEVTEGIGGLQRGTPDLVVEHGQSTIVRNAVVNMWDHRAFGFQSHVRLRDGVAASVQKPGDGSATVQVRNNTPHHLSDAAVSFRGNVSVLGSLKPGEQKTVRVSLNSQEAGGLSLPSGGEGTTSSTSRIQAALSTLAQSAQGGQPGSYSPMVLTAWFPEPVAGLTLANEKPQVQGVNLMVVHLDSPEGQGQAPPPVSFQPPARVQDPFAGSRLGPRARVLTPPPPAAGARSGAGKGPLLRLAPGQAVPPLPSTGRGSRRILQPVTGTGGWYLIEQEWDHQGGSTSASSSTSYIAPGQPLPK